VTDHEADAQESETSEREGMSRRGFIAGAAGLTGVALSGVWRGSPARAAEGGSSIGRAGTTAGREYLMLDGVVLGAVTGVVGGNPVGLLADDPPVKDPYVHKHIGGLKYEDIQLKAGLSMGQPLYDWISETLLGKATTHTGALVATDSELNIRNRLDFTNALITEVGFPALDAASKTPVGLTVKLTPETTRFRAATGKLVPPSGGQKAWLPGNFRLTIPGLDCNQVSKIDSFTVKQSGIDLTQIAVDPLSFILSEGTSSTWRTYFNSFVLRNSGNELAGTLEVLNSTLVDTLAKIEFGHMGIYMLDPVGAQPSSDEIRRVKAEMYCEEISFTRPKP
jgi:hypothetical protein